MGKLILINLCRPALGVQFFLRHSVVIIMPLVNYYCIVRNLPSGDEISTASWSHDTLNDLYILCIPSLGLL